MIKYILLLFITVMILADDEFTVFIKCSKNCGPQLCNPSMSITLIASCRGKCLGVTYSWNMDNSVDNVKQDLESSEVVGAKTQILIIKKDVLLPSEQYTIVVTAKKKDNIQTASYVLHMDKCSKKYPCKEDRDVQDIAEDYVDVVADKVKEILNWNKKPKKKQKQRTTLPTTTEAPAIVVANVANEMDNLKDLKKDANLMHSKSIELITKLNDVNLEDPEVLKQTVQLLKQYLEHSEGTKMRPNLAKATAKLTERILDAELERIKRSPNPTEDAKELHDVAAIAIRALEHSFSDNKTLLAIPTTPDTSNASIKMPAIMAEKYPDYVEFDIVYQGKKKNIISVSKKSIRTANKIGRANALTMPNRVTVDIIEIKDTCILNIVDTSSALSNKTYSVCDASIYFTEYLASELRTQMSTITITLSVIKKNLFWWQETNISTNIISMELFNTKTNQMVTSFKNPLLISSKMNQIEPTFTRGYIKIPVEDIGLLVEESMCVHQLLITQNTDKLLIQFQNVKDSDQMQVVVFKSYRPSIDDFTNSYTIPNNNRKDKFTITLTIDAEPGSYYYVGVLPSKETILNSGTQGENTTVYTYTVQFSSIQCYAWSDAVLDWMDDYCKVSDKTTFEEIYCNCYHLTTFVGSVSSIESKVYELLHIEIQLLRKFNLTVLFTVVACFLLFVCALLIALWKDRKRFKPRKVLFLMDNNTYYKYKYILAVHTGYLKNSGTTANIGIKLYGTDGESQEHILRGHREPVLQTKSSDYFLLLTKARLGNLTSVDLWTDCYGMRCSWYCKKIIVYNLESNQQWIFEINKWLSVLNNTLMLSATVVNIEIFIPETKWEHALLALETEHLWFSIIKTNSDPFHSTLLTEQFTYKLPSKWRLRCWFILITMITLFSLTLLVFGLFFGYFASLLWLTNSAIAIFICIFILESARVVIMAIRIKEIPSTYINKTFDLSEISNEKHKLRKKYGADGFRGLLFKNYQPLSEFEIKIKKEKELQRIELRNIVIDIIMFLTYLIILFCVVLINKDSFALYSTKNIEDIFVHDNYIRVIPFTEVNSKRRLFRYLRRVYFPAMFATVWYSNLTTDETGLLIDFNTKLLGIPRIRQIRIIPDSCTIPGAMKLITDECNQEYNSFIQSKSDYGPNWLPKTRRSHLKETDKIWLYQSGWDSQSSAVLGDLAYYPSGGYFALFGRTESNSRVVLEYIEKSKWIDELTRAIIIEACFYNANQNLFNILSLMVEVSAAGSFINNYSLRTSKLLFRIDELAIGTFIIFTLFVIMIFILSWKKVKQLRKSYVSTFMSDIWNIIDLVIILFAFTFLIVYFCRSLTVSALLKRLEDAAHNEFVSFNGAVFWDNSVTILACGLVALSTIRAWKLLRFLRMFRICELTLSLAIKYLIAMMLITLLIMYTYSSAGYIIFGAYSADFRSITTSFVSLILLAFGFNREFDYDVLEDSFAFIGYMYYVCYMFVLLLIINLFITIIIVAYESAKEFFDCSESEKLISYNMWNFLKDEFKYLTSITKGREEMKRLHSGEDPIDVQDDGEIKHIPGVQQEVHIDPKNLKAMHNVTVKILDILIHRFEKKHVALIPDELIAVVLANRTKDLDSDEDLEQEVADDEFFISVPSDDGNKYCSKSRIADMLIIVDYFTKTYVDKKLDSSKRLANAADKHHAMIITMNNTVLRLIRELDNLTTDKYADKSTGVTFEDLGLQAIESDDNISK